MLTNSTLEAIEPNYNKQPEIMCPLTSRSTEIEPNCAKTQRPSMGNLVKCVVFTTLLALDVCHKTGQAMKSLHSRDVTNLRLIADLRSVKLGWTYELGDRDKPAEFLVRYCELTSWNDEIKCLNKSLKVDNSSSTTPTSSSPSNEAKIEDSQRAPIATVIKSDVVHQLKPTKPNELGYEAQIFDLRAQTNYTFQVHVSRFLDELHAKLPSQLLKSSQQQQHHHHHHNYNQPNSTASQRPRYLNGRRLNNSIRDGNELEASNEIGTWSESQFGASHRVETKSFAAEANRCLANLSEVVVNTGPYFGGKISVENSANQRCQLQGNKSSEQSTYLLRINHELCKSRTVDKNRIETIVLVHENKDILTHNTARFLVLCYFPQKSFTLRASVALPRVNGLNAPVATSRPALITQLAGKPTSANLDEWKSITDNADNATQSVRLGSMPGIYRARVATSGVIAMDAQQANELVATRTVREDANQPETLEDRSAANQSNSYHPKLMLKRNDSHYQQPANDVGAISTTSVLDQSQQSSSLSSHNSLNRARSLAFDDRLQNHYANWQHKSPPEPVQVQSQVLFVEGVNPSGRQGRQQKSARPSADGAILQRPTFAAEQAATLPASSQVSGHSSVATSDSEPASVIITNNHRVGGDYLRLLDQKQQVVHSDKLPGLSYSAQASDLDSYSMAASNVAPDNKRRARVRGGRMWSTMDVEPSSTQPGQLDNIQSDTNRMGSLRESIFEADSSRLNLNPANYSLAQNLTSQLLKFSLKTLGNVARKTIDFLMRGTPNGFGLAPMAPMGVDSLEANETELVGVNQLDSDHSSHQHSSEAPSSGANGSNWTDQTTKFTLSNQISAATDKIVTVAMTTSRPNQSTDDDESNWFRSTSSSSVVSRLDLRPNESFSDEFITEVARKDASDQTQANGELSQIKKETTSKRQPKRYDLHKTRPNETNQHESMEMHKRWKDANDAIDIDKSFTYWQIFSVLFLGVSTLVLILTIWFISIHRRFDPRATGTISSTDLGGPSNPNQADHRGPFATVIGRNKLDQSSFFLDPSYQRYNDYDRLECYTNSLSRKILTTNSSEGLNRPGSSDRSTRFADSDEPTNFVESECKNSELLSTSHILINLNSEHGESYA